MFSFKVLEMIRNVFSIPFLKLIFLGGMVSMLWSCELIKPEPEEEDDDVTKPASGEFMATVDGKSFRTDKKRMYFEVKDYDHSYLVSLSAKDDQKNELDFHVTVEKSEFPGVSIPWQKI